MKIGVVVPRELNPDICRFIAQEFSEIEPVPFSYASIEEIPSLLAGRQSQADAFLFLGNTARRYTETVLPPTSEWLTIPRSTASLLRLLFRAQVAGFRMRIATDWPQTDFFRLAFREVGITDEQAVIRTLPFFPYNEALLLKDADDLERMYRAGEIDFCITIFYRVRDILLSRGVPVYILQPSYEDIRSALQRLVLAHELRASQDSQIAVIAIHTDIPEGAFPSGSGYELALEQLRVTRHIYQFARTIQAACIEQPPAGYLLFATRALIENATDHYRHFPLLAEIREDTAFTISAGFGYGLTADEAKLHAERAMEHAASTGGNCAFLIGKGLFTPVPMSQNDQKSEQKKDARAIDERFLRLSSATGVSVRIFMTLSRTARATGRTRFTSAELADQAGVTPRTMNRILQKLIDHHLAHEVGKKFTKKSGRPSRLIELTLQD